MKIFNKDFSKKLLLIFALILIPVVVMVIYSGKNTSVDTQNKLSQKFAPYFSDGYTILYIGYTGCVNICTPRLFEISTLQRALEVESKKTNYMFLDLRNLGKNVSEDFLKAFDAKIGVLELSKTMKSELMRELNFYSATSLYDSNEFEHTSYLYLIKKEKGKIVHIGTIMQYPFDNTNTIEFLKNKVSK